MRPLKIDLHKRLRAEGSNDNVGWNFCEAFRVHSLAASHFPNEAVIEAELFDLSVADAVSSTIADMADPGTFRSKEQRGGGRAHAAELGILLSLGMDAGV